MALSGLLSDASTGLASSGNLQVMVVSAVVAPVVGALGVFARWTMKQNEKLQTALEDAYKATLPVIQQSLATQREMVDSVRSLTEIYAQERARQGRR